MLKAIILRRQFKHILKTCPNKVKSEGMLWMNGRKKKTTANRGRVYHVAELGFINQMASMKPQLFHFLTV